MRQRRLLAALLPALLLALAPRAQENPAENAQPQPGMEQRHAEKVALAKASNHDLLMIGDSITHAFDDAEFKAVWDQFFAPRNALNLGFSGARTGNILWNLRNGQLEGQSPKVATLLIGTNNAFYEDRPRLYPKVWTDHHNGEQIAGGTMAIVRLLRETLPDTKLLLLRPFPYGAPDSPHRTTLDDAWNRVRKLADGKSIFLCDINHIFLNPDGSINAGLMPDLLHPNPAGAKKWAQEMEPLLSSLMGDASRDTEPPANSAVVPVSRLEKDSYNWGGRHAEALKIKDELNPEVVLIGDSITHFWGGLPASKANGPKAYEAAFGGLRTLNIGFGWDRTQNVLWRIDHGELDGLRPRTVVIHIGTNNTSQTPNARKNTAAEIAEGIREVILRVRSKAPGAKIILMAVFPREEKPDHPRRVLINEINALIADLGKQRGITFVDIGPKLANPDGTLSRDIMPDFCHPTEKGYDIWGTALKPLL